MLTIQLLLPSSSGLNIETIKTTLVTELMRFFGCTIPADKVQVTWSRGRQTAVQVTQSSPFNSTLVTRGHERFNAFKWTVIRAVNSGLRHELRLGQGPFNFATGTPGLFEGTSGADGAKPSTRAPAAASTARTSSAATAATPPCAPPPAPRSRRPWPSSAPIFLPGFASPRGLTKPGAFIMLRRPSNRPVYPFLVPWIYNLLVLTLVHSSSCYAGEVQRVQTGSKIFREVASVLLDENIILDPDADMTRFLRVEFGHNADAPTSITIQQKEPFEGFGWIGAYGSRFRVENSLMAAVNRGLGSAIGKKSYTLKTERPDDTPPIRATVPVTTDKPDTRPPPGRRRDSRSYQNACTT